MGRELKPKSHVSNFSAIDHFCGKPIKITMKEGAGGLFKKQTNSLKPLMNHIFLLSRSWIMCVKIGTRGDVRIGSGGYTRVF